MGQYWAIISIDNRETARHLGKLGEFFWIPDDSLVSRLTTPVIPASYKTDSAIGVFEGKKAKIILHQSFCHFRMSSCL
ncbi:uncharacterized protein C8R40DRAFT_615511 [Lentinula edodes]|uniref:uncharacterized protein n=1 Tax=Lentinula edodes TaxID=5353 RepID=UPI001E8DB5AA|nr:uncharacterized protein C8R40DRAFT_615511 [Lentinula edodes]KAH7870909.1 hypothetical protein C8R40DRAFT_615511 [Lentinula edodes]